MEKIERQLDGGKQLSANKSTCFEILLINLLFVLEAGRLLQLRMAIATDATTGVLCLFPLMPCSTTFLLLLSKHLKH